MIGLSLVFWARFVLVDHATHPFLYSGADNVAHGYFDGCNWHTRINDQAESVTLMACQSGPIITPRAPTCEEENAELRLWLAYEYEMNNYTNIELGRIMETLEGCGEKGHKRCSPKSLPPCAPHEVPKERCYLWPVKP